MANQSKSPQVILVGDVHGCLVELKSLLHKVGYNPGRDTVILLGDLLGKGPFGAETVAFARKNGMSALRGNHEDRLLRYRSHQERVKNVPGYFNPMKPLTGDVLETYSKLSSDDWRYLSSLPLFIEWEDTILVHGGLKGLNPANKQASRDLLNLGGEDNEETHWAYSYAGSKHVVYGHSPTLENKPRIVPRGEVITFGLDTGCVHGGRLTAMVITSGEVTFESVTAKQCYVPRSKNDTVDREVA